MASSGPRGAERMIHQDYIARIRYSNALPPPPNPPKLLDVPNTGLSNGQYTTPGFASRLARDQPLNIEADSELGMPLDLVGMPGIFDGDESSIQAPLNAPMPHPHDRALLRPLSSLGKPKFSDTGVSFLRRTEYISSHQSKSRFDSTTSKSLIGKTGNRTQRPQIAIDKESREHVCSLVEKSFTIAGGYLRDSTRIQHPSKRNLKLVESYPLLPDHDAFPDTGGYMILKFLTNPVPPSSTYDTRIEASILAPIQLTPEESAAREAMLEAHARDPTRNPPPDTTPEFEFFMPASAHQATNFKRKINPSDPQKDDESLYADVDGTNHGAFRYKRIRAYESASNEGSTTEDVGSTDRRFEEEVIVAVHDGSDGLRQKAAHYYPVIQRHQIRPQRTKNIHKHRIGQIEQDSNSVDFMDVRVADPTEDVLAMRRVFLENPYGNGGEGENVAIEENSQSEVQAPQTVDADQDTDN